mmetsp:Transcript_22562/g.71565  ORF Transcript_22562/g.71565 Transcript_22562/m.71565 type:complete len:283 (+) Transcript_22562:614-1462(+)
MEASMALVLVSGLAPQGGTRRGHNRRGHRGGCTCTFHHSLHRTLAMCFLQFWVPSPCAGAGRTQCLCTCCILYRWSRHLHGRRRPSSGSQATRSVRGSGVPSWMPGSCRPLNERSGGARPLPSTLVLLWACSASSLGGWAPTWRRTTGSFFAHRHLSAGPSRHRAGAQPPGASTSSGLTTAAGGPGGPCCGPWEESSRTGPRWAGWAQGRRREGQGSPSRGPTESPGRPPLPRAWESCLEVRRCACFLGRERTHMRAGGWVGAVAHGFVHACVRACIRACLH